MPSATVIMPKGSVFKPGQIARVLENTVEALAKNIKVDFDVTTQTWSDRPDVKVESKGPYERTIVPQGDIYPMLDVGTRPHMIRPRRARVLRFQTPFRAKTVPNQIISRAGSKGSTTVFSRGVRHPGAKPRNWAKTIAAKWRKQAPIVMQRAINAEYSR